MHLSSAKLVGNSLGVVAVQLQALPTQCALLITKVCCGVGQALLALLCTCTAETITVASLWSRGSPCSTCTAGAGRQPSWAVPVSSAYASLTHRVLTATVSHHSQSCALANPVWLLLLQPHLADARRPNRAAASEVVCVAVCQRVSWWHLGRTGCFFKRQCQGFVANCDQSCAVQCIPRQPRTTPCTAVAQSSHATSTLAHLYHPLPPVRVVVVVAVVGGRGHRTCWHCQAHNVDLQDTPIRPPPSLLTPPPAPLGRAQHTEGIWCTNQHVGMVVSCCLCLKTAGAC